MTGGKCLRRTLRMYDSALNMYARICCRYPEHARTSPRAFLCRPMQIREIFVRDLAGVTQKVRMEE